MNHKSYKFRIYPTKDQENYLAQCFGAKRFVYNYFLYLNNQRYQNKEEFLNAFGCNYIITDMKKTDEYSWMKDVDDWVLKNATNDLGQAFKQFFNSLKGKRKKSVDKPTFKKKDTRQSFRTYCKLSDKGLKIPKLKSLIKIVQHQEVVGNIKSVTISKCPSGKYFASILTEQDIIPKEHTGKEVGIDLGIKDLIITSDGVKFVHPDKITEKVNRLLKQQQKILSRKDKGSNNYERQRVKVAKLYEAITNIKKNYYHEISNYLVSSYDAIYMEDLNVSGMIRNRKLSRAIHSASWSMLSSMIEYKANWNQRSFHKINRWFPSSKTCSCCGHKMDSMGLSIREWTCPSCNTIHDRDLNAAVNIKQQGQLDLYNHIPKQQGNWDRNVSIPSVLQKLTTRIPMESGKIERSIDLSIVGRGSEQAVDLYGLS
nr:MAG: putative transposase [Caudoviricetes sp.]